MCVTPHRLNEDEKGKIKRRAAAIIAAFIPSSGSHAKAKKAAIVCARMLREQFDNEFKNDYTESPWEYERKDLMFKYLLESINAF